MPCLKSLTLLKNSFKKAGFILFYYQQEALKKAVFQKLFVMLSLVGIAAIKVETKSKIFNKKFQMSAKCETDSQSKVCVLANQKNAKVSV